MLCVLATRGEGTSGNRMIKASQIVNEAWYLWKRNNWMLDPRTYLGNHRGVTLNSPVFLLGVQGGGLTLISRMLRRHPSVVSVTGNHRYWTGADEMHTVLGPILPPELAGTRYKAPWPDHPLLEPPRSWTYACDDLLPYYRKTADDATEELKERFERLIRMSVSRHALDRHSACFTDKSQVYTVRVSLIGKLLAEHHPKFILITTNPYAVCYKAASGYAEDMRRLEKQLSLEQRLEICAQHWSNSMRCALEDRAGSMMIMKFGEILNEPDRYLREICHHIGLEYDARMVPGPADKLPIGSRYRTRWYPLVPERAFRYLNKATPNEIAIIDHYCGDVARELDYARP